MQIADHSSILSTADGITNSKGLQTRFCVPGLTYFQSAKTNKRKSNFCIGVLVQLSKILLLSFLNERHKFFYILNYKTNFRIQMVHHAFLIVKMSKSNLKHFNTDWKFKMKSCWISVRAIHKICVYSLNSLYEKIILFEILNFTSDPANSKGKVIGLIL